MSSHVKPTPWDVVRAVETFRDVGAAVVLPDSAAGGRIRVFSVQDVSEMLNVSKGWIRAHMDEFPGVSRLPGGDLRIPICDVEAALDRWREAYRIGKRDQIEAA
jgi:hypothetical protein